MTKPDPYRTSRMQGPAFLTIATELWHVLRDARHGMHIMLWYVALMGSAQRLLWGALDRGADISSSNSRMAPST